MGPRRELDCGLFGYKLIWQSAMNLIYWAYEESVNEADSYIHKLCGLTSYTSRHYPLEFDFKSKNMSNNLDMKTYMETAIENEIVQYRKSIYFSEFTEKELEYLSKNYAKRKFYKLKDTFSSSLWRWGFLFFGNLKLLKNIKTLFLRVEFIRKFKMKIKRCTT